MNYRSSTPILDVIFPRRCPICDRPVKPFGRIICEECEAVPVRTGRCTCVRCGRKLEDPGAEYCPDCMKVHHIYSRGGAVFTYRSVSGSVLRFKYRGRREYADYFAEEMSDFLLGKTSSGEWTTPDMLIPVPIHRERLLRRGYNQALLLAEGISRRTGIPCVQALERTRNTAPSKLLGVEGRRENLKSAFHAPDLAVKSKLTIVIDDIYTTGATADACAGELYRAGAADVMFLSLSC